MKILIAMDSMKGSLTSPQCGEILTKAAAEVLPAAAVTVCPLADGGEGTVTALAAGGDCSFVRCTVTGPLESPVTARYAIRTECMKADGTKEKLALIEMAEAAGLPLVPEGKRDPEKTTTRGLGELILDALDRGCRRFLIGIGGSATNDAGAGMLAALGYRLLDREGKPIGPGAAGLAALDRIDRSGADPRLSLSSFRAACDVNNPLCGTDGASAVFGPQKGAGAETVMRMDAALAAFAKLVGEDPSVPGSGAAGGLGYALRVFLGAELLPGSRIVIEENRMEEKIREADLVITGEGRIDAQTVMGKGPGAVAELAKKHGKPVLAFCGVRGAGAELCSSHGMDTIAVITPEGMTPSCAMQEETAKRNLFEAAKRELLLFRADREKGEETTG